MSSMALDGIPRSRKTDPVTSVEAGRRARLRESQAAVLKALTEVDFGLTQGELEARLPDWSGSRIRTAVSELAEVGLVEPTGMYRKTRYGRKAQVWQLTR